MNRIQLDDVLMAYRSPAQFQRELSTFIDQRLKPGSKVVEVGCETAVTTLLLSDEFERTAIDINPRAIELVTAAAERLGKKVNVQMCDMFAMPFAEDEFDLVFNAGVIEHFTLAERSRAIGEYARVMKPSGELVICYPNHFCPPYRAAYIVMNLLGVWRFPPEFKIYDLGEEAERNGLTIKARLTLSRGTIFNWLNFLPPLRFLFQIADKVLRFEGYLTVVVMKKV